MSQFSSKEYDQRFGLRRSVGGCAYVANYRAFSGGTDQRPGSKSKVGGSSGPTGRFLPGQRPLAVLMSDEDSGWQLEIALRAFLETKYPRSQVLARKGGATDQFNREITRKDVQAFCRRWPGHLVVTWLDKEVVTKAVYTPNMGTTRGMSARKGG